MNKQIIQNIEDLKFFDNKLNTNLYKIFLKNNKYIEIWIYSWSWKELRDFNIIFNSKYCESIDNSNDHLKRHLFKNAYKDFLDDNKNNSWLILWFYDYEIFQDFIKKYWKKFKTCFCSVLEWNKNFIAIIKTKI